MPRLTNEHIQSELNLVKQELTYVKDAQTKMQADLSMIKERLLNPDEGTIARVNKNTSFRKSTSKVLFSIWITLLGILTKIIFWD
jgi:hypothetical protein|tara:strand:- start:455 stop:709 length:255 start_codon:yes stop_codon:yes gene_type:complete